MVIDSNDKALKKITINFLKLMVKHQPELFMQVVNKHCKDDIGKEILKLRYIDGVKFECIPDMLSKPKSLRYVFMLHQKFITDIVYYIVADLEIA